MQNLKCNSAPHMNTQHPNYSGYTYRRSKPQTLGSRPAWRVLVIQSPKPSNLKSQILSLLAQQLPGCGLQPLCGARRRALRCQRPRWRLVQEPVLLHVKGFCGLSRCRERLRLCSGSFCHSFVKCARVCKGPRVLHSAVCRSAAGELFLGGLGLRLEVRFGQLDPGPRPPK